jgi:transcriptional regulator with XRE-family HTH domain
MGIGERLRLLRKTLGLSQAEFAQRLGVKQRAISHWENEDSEPSLKMIQKISDIWSINLIWLLTGEGPMFREKEDPPPAREDSSEGLSPELLRALSHPTIRNIALMLSEMSEEDIKEILKRVEEKATLKRLLQRIEILENQIKKTG